MVGGGSHCAQCWSTFLLESLHPFNKSHGIEHVLKDHPVWLGHLGVCCKHALWVLSILPEIYRLTYI